MTDGNDGMPGLVPRPDPTLLTNAAVAQAKDELRRELASLRENIDTQLKAIEENRRLVLQIMDERKAEIQRRFTERDVRFDERDHARQEAVHTALTAARELNDARDAATEQASQKFEAAVQEQIRQTAALFQVGRERLDASIAALKERMDRNEGGHAGTTEYRTEHRLNMSQVVAIIAVFVALAGPLLLLVFQHK